MQNPMVPYFQSVDVPGRAFRGNRYTDTQTDYRNPPAHARRGLTKNRVQQLIYLAFTI